MTRCTISLLITLTAGTPAASAPPPAMPTETARVLQPDVSSETVEQRTRRLVSERLARLGVLLVRNLPSPAVEDYELVGHILDKAMELAPANAEMARMAIDAWNAAERPDLALEATSRLVRLDPADTVAQLRLITSRLNALQTIEERIAAHKNLLGPAGAPLDAAIRSRLAFDAALLERETGDEAAFLRLLTTAIELDQTNKPAALLASALFLERETDPVRRAEMLVQLILADPLDAETHLRLGRELLQRGAYEGSKRFFDIALTIRTKLEQQPSEEFLEDFFTLRWGIDGAEKALDRFAEDEAAQRYLLDANRRQLEQSGEDPDAIPSYTPNPIEDRARVLMAASIGRTEEASRLLTRFTETLLGGITARAQSGNVTQEQLDAVQLRAASELLRLRAITGLNLDEARSGLNAIRDADGSTLRDDASARYTGLFAAHEGRRDEAQRLLQPLADSGDGLARLGLAVAAETAGDRTAATLAYAELARDAPGTMHGLWSRERLTAILGSAPNPSTTAVALNALAAQAPRQLDRMAANVTEYEALRVSLLGSELGALETLTARIELKNTGVFPLALGPQSPLVSRIMLTPKMTIAGQPVTSGVVPEIVSLARRLRLLPGETLVVDAWLGAGQVGAMIDGSTPLAASLRVQAVQGYRYDGRSGTYAHDPFSLAASSGILWRRPLESAPTVDLLIERTATAQGDEFLQTLLAAQWYFVRAAAPGETIETLREEQRRLAEAIAQRYPGLSLLERALTLMLVPPGWQLEPTAPVEEAALALPPEPLTELVLVVTRGSTATHPSFQRAATLDDHGVREVARLLALRLTVAKRLNERAGTEPVK